MNRSKLTVRVVGSLAAVLVTAGLSLTVSASADAGASDRDSPRVVVARRPALAATTPRFSVDLPDIPEGAGFPVDQQLSGFGCTGGNLSPAITWRGAPAATKSYLITLFDTDAPTGSGFWHWVVWNIPAGTHGLSEGVGTAGQGGLPEPAVLGPTDYGFVGYGGPCPPVGGSPQRYVFSVVALDVADIEVPPDLPAAAVQVVMRDHALAVATRAVDFSL